MEGKMIDQLREVAGMGGPAAALANELLVLREQYEKQELTFEEYQYLTNQIAEVRAAQELSSDEQACRYIIAAAKALSTFV
jgi:5-bromo-4-chloroindolyl phosphate hydrolysis protein